MVEQVNRCFSLELVDGTAGNFNSDGIRKFEKDLKLTERGFSYSVVSIMGPQSSGKSTLMNHLFGTNFKEMNAEFGRNQATNGIWMSKSPLVEESCILVIDTEGFDGVERKDNTTFERQTVVFATAISDIVILNMWCHDLGRRNASCWPLLTTVFEVTIRKVSTPRKVSLVFVLRDKTKSPFNELERQLNKHIKQIWDEIPKTPDQVYTALIDHFKIEVVAMPNYEKQEVQFKEEVNSLRDRLVCSCSSGELAKHKIPASTFAQNAEMIWCDIKRDKNLDLPSQQIMVAHVRCKEIAEEIYQVFCENKYWLQIKKEAESGAVEGFGEKVSLLISTSLLDEYDKKALYLHEATKVERRKLLTGKLLQVVEPTYLSILGHISDAILENFEKAIENDVKKGKGLLGVVKDYTRNSLIELDKRFADAAVKQANWNHATKQNQKLQQEMRAYEDKMREIDEALQKHQKLYHEGRIREQNEEVHQLKLYFEAKVRELEETKQNQKLQQEMCAYEDKICEIVEAVQQQQKLYHEGIIHELNEVHRQKLHYEATVRELKDKQKKDNNMKIWTDFALRLAALGMSLFGIPLLQYW